MYIYIYIYIYIYEYIYIWMPCAGHTSSSECGGSTRKFNTVLVFESTQGWRRTPIDDRSRWAPTGANLYGALRR